MIRKSVLSTILIFSLFTSVILAQEPTREQMQEIQSKLNSAKNPAKKIEILKELTVQFPNSNIVPSAYNYILRLYVRDLNDPAKAIVFAEEVLKTEKTEANKTAAYIFLFSRYLEKDTERAITMAEKILQLGIKDDGVYNNIASTLAEKGLALDLAEKLSNKSINLTTIENLKNNPRYQKAPEQYLKKILDNKLGYYYDTLGWIYFKQEKNKKATEYLKKATAKSDMDFLQLPYEPDALFHLGTVYMKTKKNEKALLFLTKALIVSNKEEIRSALSKSYQKKFGSTEGFNKFIKEQRIKLAKPAPDFTLKNLKGKSVSLSSFKGNIVLLNLSSPDCGPCIAEFPHLVTLHNKYRKKGFSVIVVDASNNAVKTKEMVAKNKSTMPVLLDDQRIAWEKYNIPGTPTSYLLDKQGKAIYRHVGFAPGMEKKMEKEIQELLGLKEK